MQAGPWASYSTFAAVVPSNTTPVSCRALLVIGIGQITIAASVGGAPVSLGATLPVGTVIPVELNQGTVNAATVATLIALA